MTTLHFSIAKYIPDVFRNEPRNIGVILWTPEATLARFAGERPGAPGEIADADMPPFVNAPEVYREWVRYWRRELAKPAIRPATGGRPVPRTSPECLDALRQTGPGNYILEATNQVTLVVPPDAIPVLLDDLFAELVTPPSAPPGDSRTSLVRKRNRSLTAKITDVVAYLHADVITCLDAEKVLDSDWKPSNVMAGPGVTPQLIDFNLASPLAPVLDDRSTWAHATHPALPQFCDKYYWGDEEFSDRVLIENEYRDFWRESIRPTAQDEAILRMWASLAGARRWIDRTRNS